MFLGKQILFCCKVMGSELPVIKELNLSAKPGNFVRVSAQDLVLVKKLN